MAMLGYGGQEAVHLNRIPINLSVAKEPDPEPDIETEELLEETEESQEEETKPDLDPPRVEPPFVEPILVRPLVASENKPGVAVRIVSPKGKGK